MIKHAFSTPQIADCAEVWNASEVDMRYKITLTEKVNV